MSSASRILLSTISKKIIKPYSRTSSSQRWHKLSLLDQLPVINVHIPFVFFYPKQQVDTIPGGPKKLSELLRNSLSKALTLYYPWAGSLKDDATIECNDSGAEFLEVQVSYPMDKVVNHPDSDLTLFPGGVTWFNTGSALTVVQLSHFDCGGIAISTCLSHKVGDGCSAYSFFRDWAALTRHPNNIVSTTPYFIQDSLIRSPFDGPLEFPVTETKKEDEFISKRFILSASKLIALKALVAEESLVQNPTRTEVVSALFYRCAALANMERRRCFQQSQLLLTAETRKGISPPLPPTSIGNMVTLISTPIYNEGDLRLPKLVADLRKSKLQKFSSSIDRLRERDYFLETMINPLRRGEKPFSPRDAYISSSICNMPFLDLDFGWGKPSRASFGSTTGPLSNTFFLMSNPDGGLQVFVNLNEQQMSVFENDNLLLHYAYSSS